MPKILEVRNNKVLHYRKHLKIAMGITNNTFPQIFELTCS